MQEDKCFWCKGEGFDVRLDDNGNLIRVCEECPYTEEFFNEYENNNYE